MKPVSTLFDTLIFLTRPVPFDPSDVFSAWLSRARVQHLRREKTDITLLRYLLGDLPLEPPN